MKDVLMKTADKRSGKFIVIEGLDGSGKTIQSRMLFDYLIQSNYPVNLSYEPTHGPIGSILRQALIGRIIVDPKTIAALFAADRLDHIYNPTDGILKHLNKGIIEISDRYYLTSFAYQTLEVDQSWVWELNSQAIKPDLIIFLDVDPQECFRRISSSLIDDEMYHKIDHFNKARFKYLEVINKLKETEIIEIIDANTSVEEVNEKVKAVIQAFLPENKNTKE